MKVLSQQNRSPGRDPNPASPEQKSRALQLDQPVGQKLEKSRSEFCLRGSDGSGHCSEQCPEAVITYRYCKEARSHQTERSSVRHYQWPQKQGYEMRGIWYSPFSSLSPLTLPLLMLSRYLILVLILFCYAVQIRKFHLLFLHPFSVYSSLNHSYPEILLHSTLKFISQPTGNTLSLH